MEVQVENTPHTAERLTRGSLGDGTLLSPLCLNRQSTPVSPGPLPDMPGMEINFRNTFLEVSPKLSVSMPRPQTMPNLNEQLAMGSPTYIEDLEFDFVHGDGIGLLEEAHVDTTGAFGSDVYDANTFRDACETLLSCGTNDVSDTVSGLMIEGLHSGLSPMVDIPNRGNGCSYSPASRQQYKINREVNSTQPEDLPPDMLTTVMLRNIPNKLSQMDIANAVKHEGFLGEFDFFYSPLDFKSGSNLGYAFINFTSHEVAVRFRDTIAGVLLARSVAEANTSGLYWDDSNTSSKATIITPEVSAQLMRSNKQCGVAWARIQGLEANIKHYRNSPVNELASEFRPMLFATKELVVDHPAIPAGAALPFPLPDRSNNMMTSQYHYNNNREHIAGMQQQQRQAQKFRGTNNILTQAQCAQKIFAGGLSNATSSESLASYFTLRFPMFDLVEAVVIMDRRSGVSKGFGFVTFASDEAVQHILHPMNGPHIIDGHPVVLRNYTSSR
ncbi:hypothetical protein FOL47_006829 [Perkinsus chesapeaki]|uniref:RRM domain-containing protein n=1 Tax=Perkinsus chesapeaki TaxID=330153 RepID=A0A7J6MWM8_PERCH|nr:hypothetical protein FOL47_006829 [Perkinsus chesapeaki]